MDGSRFDALSRSLTTGHSRRALTRILSSLAFSGTLTRCGVTATAAKGKHHQRHGQAQGKKKKPCPACKKRKKGKCKGLLPDGTTCAGGTCQGGSCLPTASPPPPSPPPPPAPTCRDGIQNGSESDVDCGGPECPRCANGQACVSQGDCVSAFCANTVCQTCTGIDSCGPGCNCLNQACVTFNDSFMTDDCTDCPLYWSCLGSGGDPMWRCWPPCGSA